MRQPSYVGEGSTFQLLERFSKVEQVGRGGVILQPSYIGEGSTFNRGVQPGPSTILSRGVTVGEDAVVRESIIFENTTIGRECLIDGAIVGERVHIGPRTRIGRGSIIAGEVNFPSRSVVKKSMVILN